MALACLLLAAPPLMAGDTAAKLMRLYAASGLVEPIGRQEEPEPGGEEETADDSGGGRDEAAEPSDRDAPDRDFYDKAHDWIENRLQKTTEDLDFYFGGEHRVEDRPYSGGRLRTSVIIEDSGDTSVKPKFDVKVYLPNLENRVGLFFDNLANNVLPGTTPEDEDSDVDIGIRNTLFKDKESWIYLDGGLSYHDELVAFGRLSLIRHTWFVSSWRARFEQKVLYYTDRGLGESSRLDFDLRPSESVHLRTTIGGVWSKWTKGLEWQVAFKCGIDLTYQERGFFIQALVNGHDLKPIDNYILHFTFRTRVFKPYIMLDITPQIEFPREQDYDFTPSLRFALEIYFGHYYKRRKI